MKYETCKPEVNSLETYKYRKICHDINTNNNEIGKNGCVFFYRTNKLRVKFRLPPAGLAGGGKIDNQGNIHDTSSKLAVWLLFLLENLASLIYK